MATTLDPGELAARVRRDAERSVLRLRNGLKHAAGVGRPTLSRTPRDVVWRSEKAELWRYRSDDRQVRTPLLFVHSLVSRSYVFDLVPGNSVVEAMLGQGFDVFLVDWGVPDELEAANTLETYTDGYIPRIIDHVAELTDSEVNVFGYCFGGVMSMLSVAGNASPVRSLAVQATPVDWSRMGPFTTLLQQGRLEPDQVIDQTGNVSEDVMLNSMRVVQPIGEITQYVDLWQHLWNDQYVAAHQVMTHWATDHIPFPGAAFRQTVDLFARRNLLMTGHVPLGGRTVDLSAITVPFLNILGEKDTLVPAESSMPATGLVGSDDAEEFRHPAGHVGLVVGRTAHKKYLPALGDWLRRHSDPVTEGDTR
ncbi:MAG TPA: alpha/beta fold hydrolase [Marmoricola sp.]|nr:alpha/beta fold hydrolase [Marmoricola sp.]